MGIIILLIVSFACVALSGTVITVRVWNYASRKMENKKDDLLCFRNDY